MGLLQLLTNIKQSFFCEKYRAAKRKQRFIMDITTTRAFERMSHQDKITSLAKLIFLYECDHGRSPRILEQMLVRLNGDLKRQVIKDWGGVYAGKW